MVTLSNDDIKLLAVFERMTGAPADDLLVEGDAVAFIVPQGFMGRAIGKNGSNIERVREALGKRVFLFENAQKPEEFIQNLFSPVPVNNINFQERNNEKTAFVKIDSKHRGIAIGRGGEKVKLAQALLERRFDVKLKLVSL